MRQWIWLSVFILSSWAGAFGIAVSVHEWREEPLPEPVAEERIAPIETGPTEAELDTRKCEAALAAAGLALSGPPTEGFSAFSPGQIVSFSPNVPEDIQKLIDRYCR